MFLKTWKSASVAETSSSMQYNRLSLGKGGPDDIPQDVPKGHLVVYVGNELKRFVIRITILRHPLFQALLDLAQQEYGFSSTTKLCIPCEEDCFLSTLRCIASQKRRKVCFCF